jgi:hypothetical protein
MYRGLVAVVFRIREIEVTAGVPDNEAALREAAASSARPSLMA